LRIDQAKNGTYKISIPKSQIPNKSEIPICNEQRVWFEILNGEYSAIPALPLGRRALIWGIEIYLLFGPCDLLLDDSLQGVA
jgi:hypothetical protein